jgi:nuclear factor related to kappa-B-binding protein
VRDAASKLPGGVGSRPDVTLLLRESQYVVETVEEAAFSSLVSGALDRLKSDLDPSVRYDGELKLWIYLHRQREMADYGSSGIK